MAGSILSPLGEHIGAVCSEVFVWAARSVHAWVWEMWGGIRKWVPLGLGYSEGHESWSLW